MNDFRAVSLSEAAVRKAIALGMTGDVADRLQRMCKRSAPCTHPLGNRRFDHYVLKVEGGVMLSIHDMATEQKTN